MVGVSVRLNCVQKMRFSRSGHIRLTCSFQFPQIQEGHVHASQLKMTDPWIGYQISEFVIEKALGQGGMGTVYLAHHMRISEKRVAIKVLLSKMEEREEVRKRFELEAKVIARITHPNVVSMQNFGLVDGPGGVALYMIMEYLEGESLAGYLERAACPPLTDVYEILLQAMQGMKAAHSLGVVHRDLKPENIYLARQSDGVRVVKVLDFGLARSLQGSMRLTATDSLMGTPYYMSPEQARGKVADIQTDVYAMGTILYEMITSRMPFDGDTELVIVSRISNVGDRPSAPRSIDPSIPPGLEWVTAKAMAYDKTRRYSSMGEMMEDLRLVSKGELPKMAKLDDALVVFSDVPSVSRPGKTRSLSGTDRKHIPTPIPRNMETLDHVTIPRQHIPVRPTLIGVVLMLMISLGFAVWLHSRAGSSVEVTAILPQNPDSSRIVPATRVQMPVVLPQLPPSLPNTHAVSTIVPAVVVDAGRARPVTRRIRPRVTPCGQSDRNGLIIPCF